MILAGLASLGISAGEADGLEEIERPLIRKLEGAAFLHLTDYGDETLGKFNHADIDLGIDEIALGKTGANHLRGVIY